MAARSAITIDEFEQLPAALAENSELIDGELVDVSGNTPIHNAIRDFLVELLRPRVADQKLGKIISEQEFDFDGNAHGPDLALIGASKMGLIDPRKRVQRFVPDFAIEIVSPNDRFEQLMSKATRYRRCGTKEVWIISPDTRDAFVQSDKRRAFLGENDLLETDLIPGFSIRLGDLLDRAL